MLLLSFLRDRRPTQTIWEKPKETFFSTSICQSVEMEKIAKTVCHLVPGGAQSCALPAAYLTDQGHGHAWGHGAHRIEALELPD